MAPQLRDHDRYDILSEHGRGGLGRVSRAHDRELGRDIAIKELISRGALSEVRFLREALITARLEHPGIVPVYEAGRWPDGTPFYAMKLVSGRPLRELIAERKTVDERLPLLHHVIAVADAIAYAHGRSIIHRDLKPANVIVGEFGETVVIDWGLAKDLTAAEESTVAGGPFREHRDDGLTSAGTVLGTPAYMAPEQARGEPVDQRADVFAIGAMLWELCSLHKLPPSSSDLRRRILRTSGIDPDLIAIIDKALDPDPGRRYPDAGALAADLKAFKAGARIAARRYSPWAVLAHWTRRHRALALSIVAAMALGAAGITVYIHDIAEQRDRADHSEATARASLDEMTLDHAALLLNTDPSAANDLLATYRGSNRDRAAQISADGLGRGVAVLRAKPHTDRIRWTTGTRDGSVLSLSTDGTITRTSREATTTVLQRGVSSRGRFAYSRTRGLLAFSCDPANVCLWSVTSDRDVISPPILQQQQLGGLAISPGGARLALLSSTGIIDILDISVPASPVRLLQVQREPGAGMIFVDDDTLAVGIHGTLSIELLHTGGGARSLAIGGTFVWDSNPREHGVVLGTQHGEGLYLTDMPLRVSSRTSLCHGALAGIKLVRDRRLAAYACKDGTVGLWELETSRTSPLARLEGHADSIDVDPSGDYIAAAGIDGTLSVIDIQTGLLTSYRGHSSRLTAISVPSSDHPYFISGDAHGALRVWPRPHRIARVIADVQTRFTSAIYGGSGDTLIAATFRPELSVLSRADRARTVSPHLASAMYLESSRTGRTFAAYGAGETIEIWALDPPLLQRTFSTGQGTISRAVFIDDTDDLVTGGRDGRVIHWTPNGDRKQTLQLRAPIADIAAIHRARMLLATTADGAIWRIGSDGTPVLLADQGPPVTRMVEASGPGLVVTGSADGEVTLVDPASGRRRSILRASQAIRDIAVTRDGHTIATADNDDVIHVGHIRHTGHVDVTLADADVRWTAFRAPAGKIALTSDGILITAGSEGVISMYSSTHGSWVSLRTGPADMSILVVSADEKSAAAFDTDGRVIVVDLELARGVLRAEHGNSEKGSADR